MRLSAIRGAGSGVLLLVLALCSAVPTPQGLVLCVAAGDHVAIETAVELVPCVAPLAQDGDSMGSQFPESCVDTPLVQSALKGGSDARADTPPLAIVRTLDSAPLPIVRFPRNALDAREPRAAELQAHRTIVLIV